jgi:cysteine-rich repeat protein
MLPIPAHWSTRTVRVSAGVAGLFVVAALLVLTTGTFDQPFVYKDIPLPFGGQTTSLRGAVTLFGQRNGINVYDVTFNNEESLEHLAIDKIYLVHVPNDSTVSDVAFDLALSLTAQGGHAVDYFGYRYSDAAATSERRDINAVKFTDRFPGQFFASKKARENDAQNGSTLQAFENAYHINFLPTDGSLGTVRIDPFGALYVVVVNSPEGADLRIRNIVVCGNKRIDGDDECDDGNLSNADSCLNSCKIAPPIPFDEGPTGAGANLALVQQEQPVTAVAASGKHEISLLRFTATASDLTQIERLSFKADTGELTTLRHYTLFADTDHNGSAETEISIPASNVGQILTFEKGLQWNGTSPFSAATIFELKADVPDGLAVSKQIQVSLASTTEHYVVGQRIGGIFPLFGIRTNGVCTTPLCQINVSLLPSTVWTVGGQQQGSSSSVSSASSSSIASSTSSSSSSTPISTLCGNGSVDQGEECDDGNTVNTDDCDNTCQLSTPTPDFGGGTPHCGDGQLAGNEECDDGDIVSGDGCSTSCVTESGFICTGVPSSCAHTEPPLSTRDRVKAIADVNHDGRVSDQEALITTLDAVEAPDKPYAQVQKFDMNNDGKIDNADITIVLAELEALTADNPNLCGNATFDQGEECDDGNSVDTDDCTNLCQVGTPTPSL